MSSVTMTSDSVPVEQPSRKPRWAAIAVFAAVGAAIVAALFLIRLPYYLIQPGSVQPAEQRIDVTGAKSYSTRGRVLFTTVYIDQATPALMIRAWLDDAVEVRTREEMYPDSDRDAARRENVVLMDDSKLAATKVALTYLGIDAEFDGDGARVAGLIDDSPSSGVLQVGDVITKVNGNAVNTPDDVGTQLKGSGPGDRVEVTVERSDKSDKSKTERLEVALGKAPDEPDRGILGIQVAPSRLWVDSPVDVKVDSGTVTGPSAGLAWTLAIIDRLTPGSLTDGRRIAVTGEIRADGSVGPVGGVEQKVSAVRRAGISTFIFPAETSKEDQAAMRKIAGDKVKLHPVESVDEAVKILAPEGVEKPK